jgi:hypothetical protein
MTVCRLAVDGEFQLIAHNSYGEVCDAYRDQSLVPVVAYAGVFRDLVCRRGIERRHATG